MDFGDTNGRRAVYFLSFLFLLVLDSIAATRKAQAVHSKPPGVSRFAQLVWAHRAPAAQGRKKCNGILFRGGGREKEEKRSEETAVRNWVGREIRGIR